MAGFSLQQAADAAQTSKSSIFRALKSGRMSGTRMENGGWSIDPAELFRIFPRSGVAQAETCFRDQTEPTIGTGTVPPRQARLVHAMQARIAVLEAELSAERRRSDDLKGDRDRWADQAQRLAISAPAPTKPESIMSRIFGQKRA